ncbi:MAG: PAS domain S-box protein, partial [Nitrospirales bacterium]|nr:PAS domain S-box protein [Nitrospirales bacterium]
LLSDRILLSLISDPAVLTRLQTAKGWLFILITAVLLYILISRYLALLHRSERALSESEEKFISLAESTASAIFICSGTFLYVNPAMRLLTGFSREELLQRNLYDLATPEFKSSARKCGEGYLADDRSPARYEFKITTKGGEERWIDFTVSRIAYKGVPSIIGTAFDVTDRKRTEEALWETTRTLQSFIQASPLALVVLDPEGRVKLWNPAAERIFGWSAREVLDKPYPLIPKEKQEEFRSQEDSVLQGQVITGMEAPRRKKDGSLIGASISTAPVYGAGGTVTGTMLILEDISARKHAEAALRDSEEQYRIVAETAQDAIITIDENDTIMLVNKAAERIFGYTREELLGKPVTMLMPEPMRERHAAAVKKHIETGKRSISWVAVGLPGLHKSGKEIFLEISYGESIKEGKYYFIGIIRDVTLRKEAEESLKESEKKYRDLFEESKDAVYISTPQGEFLDINPAGVELFGFSSKEEILSADLGRDIYVNPQEREAFKQIIDRDGFVKDFEVLMRRMDGERLNILITGAAVRNEKGEVTVYRGFMRDVTNQRKLEQQLLQSQKMEATGKLAGGIAHDFNNILTAIISYGSLLQMTLPRDNPARSHAEQILTLADRAANLTQSLLAFSRKQIMNPKPVDMNEIIRRVQKLLSRLIGEDITLETSLSDEDVTAMADSGQIEQVLMNLATNARDAMPEGGSLILRTDLITMDKDFLRRYGYGSPGHYVRISVSDTGSGMNEAIMKRIFDPFFTTKEVGKGTGLGLSIVYGIVKQHNGYINVYSEPGKGTTFRIYLPLYRVQAGGPEEIPEEAPAPRGTETVLLAEDEEPVRTTTGTVLRQFGYTVIEAVDGEDALRKYGEHRDEIDLLLLDVIMPKKNGKEVYSEIKGVRPDIRVLFSSGYTSDIMHRKGILEAGLPFLSKPYTPGDLLLKIREVLQK